MADLIRIADFFDVNNIEHIKAYQYLCKHGHWEIQFHDENLALLYFSPCWQMELAQKLADAYVANFLYFNKGEDD